MAKSSKPTSKTTSKASSKATPPKTSAPAAIARTTQAVADAAALASTTLNVTVSGGITPLPIQVSFLKDGNNISTFSFSNSFTHTFTGLVKGSSYDITVGGFNPAGGSTVISVTTDQITLSSVSDSSPITKNGKSYLVDFNFTVNP
ncbi:hypothetical protein ACI6Q2_13880 [Chitinophagaceae bacterium LWZ2-11]